MIPKYFPDVLTKIIGQRVGMSDRDAEKLRKMYCEPGMKTSPVTSFVAVTSRDFVFSDCTDYHVWCGYWATENYCLDGRYYSYMKSTCMKSCGFCPGGANV